MTEKEYRLTPDGYFKVSNEGDVLRLVNGEEIPIPNHTDKTKYAMTGHKYKHFAVHRMIALAFVPNPNNYPQVNHIDGDKSNNRIDNLEWVTISQNVIHAYKIGLIRTKGNRVPCKKCGKPTRAGGDVCTACYRRPKMYKQLDEVKIGDILHGQSYATDEMCFYQVMAKLKCPDLLIRKIKCAFDLRLDGTITPCKNEFSEEAREGWWEKGGVFVNNYLFLRPMEPVKIQAR